MKDSLLYIADVGSSGGPEEHWHPYFDRCHFYLFDPEPRATTVEKENMENFPIGLWSKRCSKKLNLMHFPQSSSLFDINYPAVKGFICEECHEKVGEKSIELETLDHLLKGREIDFLKIDAEGAELEIMKGGEEHLQKVLGVQLEVSFCQRHINGPLFSEIDLYIRPFGFELFQLKREHWVRKNDLWTMSSAHQLIFGNALYLLSKEAFLQRYHATEEKRPLLEKYLLILKAYHLYDYAHAICEAVGAEDLKATIDAGQKTEKQVKQLIRKIIRCWWKKRRAKTPQEREQWNYQLVRYSHQLGSGFCNLRLFPWAVADD